MPRGQKHLIKCRCVLQQFKDRQNPPQHHFTVFSVINDDETVVPSYAQCNNCGIVHKISDFCNSEVIQRENMPTLVTVEEVKLSLPDKLLAVLSRFENDIELSTWQLIAYSYDNDVWGQPIVLTTTRELNEVTYKILMLLGKSLFKIDTRISKEMI